MFTLIIMVSCVLPLVAPVYFSHLVSLSGSFHPRRKVSAVTIAGWLLASTEIDVVVTIVVIVAIVVINIVIIISSSSSSSFITVIDIIYIVIIQTENLPLLTVFPS